MEAFLSYNLDDASDREAHLRAVTSLNLALCLWGISQLRKGIERELENASEGQTLPTAYETLDMIFDRVQAIFEEYNIDLDELIT